MEQGSRYILWAMLLMLAISCFYFIGLFLGLPVVVPGIAALVTGVLLFRKIVLVHEPVTGVEKVTSWVGLLVYTIGIAILTQKIVAEAQKYGQWDAWAMWNYHARFLASADHWRNVFLNQENDHPDYPAGLPALIAFFWRLLGNSNTVVPFAVGLFTTLAAPTLIFSEFYKKNITGATLGLMYMAANAFFIHIGVAQYADPVLGLFFLTAIICLDHLAEQPIYAAYAAACLGACIWIKNEGMILAGLTMLFYGHRLFARRYLKLTVAGSVLPLATWALFRTCVHTPNDMVDGLNAGTWNKIADPGRYQMILHELNVNLKEHFPYLKGITIFYLLVCFLRRKWPNRQMLLVLSCLMVYMLIYVVTRQDLEWHLKSSQDRLLVQLLPAFVYAVLAWVAGKSRTPSPQFIFRQV